MKILLPVALRKTRAAAFTLIEQLVGVSIVGVAITSLYAGFSSGFAVVQLARENLRGTQILQEKMETIRLYTMDQLTNSSPTNYIPRTFTSPFYPLTQTNGKGLIYTGTLSVSNAPFSTNYTNDLKLVTVELVWTNADIVRRRTMSTLVGRNGLQSYIY